VIYIKWKEGDEEGNWTYTRGREESVIDYILGEEEGREGEVGGRDKVDHYPVVMWMKGGDKRRARGERVRGCGMRKGERGSGMI